MKYAYGASEEEFSGSIDCDNVEEAISEAIRELDLEVGQKVFVGKTRDYNASLCAQTILENLGEEASNEIGDAADDWPNVSKEEEEKLNKALNEVFDKWLEETNNKPHFYHIDDFEGIAVTQELYDKAYGYKTP